MTSPIRIASVLALLFVFAAGCDTIVQEDEATPPTLIPAQAFTVQTALFEQGQRDKAGVGTHAMIARLRMWPVTEALAAHLALPTTLMQAALEEKPVIEQGKWAWKATTTAEGQEVDFVLSGAFHAGHVDWSMRVAGIASDPDSTTVLYTAKTTLDGSSGSWELFAPHADSTRSVLHAEFEIEEEDKKQIRFQVPATASEHAGDAIVYEREGDARSFRWMQPDAKREHFVSWDAEARNGSITATNYNDGAKACWDDALQNEECSD